MVRAGNYVAPMELLVMSLFAAEFPERGVDGCGVLLDQVPLLRRAFTSHQDLTAFGRAACKAPLPPSALHASFPLRVANARAVLMSIRRLAAI